MLKKRYNTISIFVKKGSKAPKTPIGYKFFKKEDSYRDGKLYVFIKED